MEDDMPLSPPPPPSQISEHDTSPPLSPVNLTSSRLSSSSSSGYPDRSFENRADEPLTPTQAERVNHRKRKKREEPTSPVVVVLYVIALYLIFQILTRSDEHEILSHLPLSSSNKQSHSPLSTMEIPHQSQHYVPYQFPPIPNPIPSAPKDESSLSFWRILLGIIAYPFYLIITIIVTPLPLLLTLAHILKEILIVLLSPITTTVRLLFRTFVLGPWSVVQGIIEMFYPVYVFVGGVVGVGVILGLGAGWVARTCLDWALSWKERRRQKSESQKKADGRSHHGQSSKRSRVSSGSRSSRSSPTTVYTPARPARTTAYTVETPSPVRRKDEVYSRSYTYETPRSSSAGSRRQRSSSSSHPSSHAQVRGRSHSSSSDEEIATPLREITDPISLFDEDRPAYRYAAGGGGRGKDRKLSLEEEGRGTARDGVVVGIRRRGVKEGSGTGR